MGLTRRDLSTSGAGAGSLLLFVDSMLSDRGYLCSLSEVKPALSFNRILSYHKNPLTLMIFYGRIQRRNLLWETPVMMRTLLVLIAVAALLVSSITAASAFSRLYAYAPMNAVGAEPKTPYNLNHVHRWGKLFNYPCPSCVPAHLLFPDAPPISQRMRGPWGVPVPVP